MTENIYDVIIVGGGLSGFSAATQAADKGLNALLLEKGKTVGGSGNYVEGVFAADSDLQAKQGIKLDKEKILQEEMNYSHYEGNYEMWRNYIYQAGQNVKWLQKHGVKFNQVASLGTGIDTWHLFDGLGHNAIHLGLKPYVESKGIQIVTQAKVTAIAKTDYGFKLTSNGKQYRAKNVVLATGGYLNNENMVNETSFTKRSNILPMNSGKSTGDGIRMAWNLGAKKFITGMKMRFGAQLYDPNVPPYKLWESQLGGLVVSAQPLLWVNENGDRFVDENHAVDDWASQGNVINRQESVYVILDQKIIEQLTNKQILKDMHPFYTENTLPGLKEEISDALDKGYKFLIKADTLQELQDKIHASNLVETVYRYNNLVSEGKDTDFGKPGKYLVSVDQAPFYAVKVGCGAYTTGDGLKVNLNNEVLDEKGKPITGLYAIGSDGSGILYGDTYGVEVPGSHAGYCVFSGRNAINAITKNK